MSAAVHHDMPMLDYLALEAVSASLLHQFRRSPLHARHYLTQPREDTASLIVGEAVHYAILEPAKFYERYALPPKVDKRTTAGKAEWAAWLADNPNVVPLTHDEYKTAEGISGAALSDPGVADLFGGKGMSEVTILWEDDGIACKARPDRIATMGDETIILDIKTCRDASERGFARAVGEYGYHNKAAWYLDAANRISERERRFVFLAVENSEPYASALYELTDEAVGQGREQNRIALAQYRDCVSTGRWPGYPRGINYIDIPKWAYTVETV